MYRYDRQIQLKHIGQKGQEKLMNSKVAIVGLGAIGTVSAELLARSGVGKLILIDHDRVDETNLQRQLLYSELDLGKPKAEVAEEKLRVINSDIEIESHYLHLTFDVVDVLEADIILDCTDNMETRFLLNDFAMKNSIPWIYAAAVEDRGMLYITKGSPCFNCIFEKTSSIENCDNVGILNAASTQISSMQVTEAIKLLLGEKNEENLLHVNFWNHEVKKLKVSKKKDCNACRGKFTFLEEPKQDYSLKYCQVEKTMSAKPLRNMKVNLNNLKKQFKVLADSDSLIAINVDGEDIIVRDYGELLFKTEKNKERLKGLADKVYEAAKV